MANERGEQTESIHGLAVRLRDAVLTGFLAGIAATAFHAFVQAADRLREHLHERAPEETIRHLLVVGIASVVVSAAFVALAAWLVHRLAPDAVGSGIPTVKEVLQRHRPLAWFRIFWVKFASGALAIAAGLALGREGPTVQMGGSLAQGFARRTGGGPSRERALLVMGSAAGLAAAFNAPLAGVFFAVEELRVTLRPREAIAVLFSTSTAVWLGRVVFGQAPVFATPAFAHPALASYPLHLLLGATMGLAGVLFNRALLGTMNVFDGLRRRFGPASVAALVGAAIGIVGTFAPRLLGPGEGLINDAIGGGIPVVATIGILLARSSLTFASYSTATAGGLFAPILVIGAQAGLLFGHGADALLPSWAGPPGIFAAAGMAALLTGAVRSPVTSVVLMIEMTESYALAMPLLLASLAAHVVADALGDVPIYDALLDRSLAERPPGADSQARG